MTQPQGHSTSGSHERYKSKERLRLGGRVRLHPQDARVDDRPGHRHRRGARRARGGGPAARARGAAPRLGRVPRADRRRSEDGRSGCSTSSPRVGAADDATIERLPHELAKRRRRRFRRDAMRALPRARSSARGEPDAAGRRSSTGGASTSGRTTTRYDDRTSTADGAESALARRRSPAEYADDAPVINGFEIINACFDAALGALSERDRLRRGRRQARRRQPGLRRPAGKVRRCCASPTPASASARSSARPSAWRCADCGRSPRSSTSTTSSTRCRSSPTIWRRCAGARAAGRRPGHHPHARPPARRHLALRLADGGHHQSRARHVRLRAAQHDPGRRLLQHAAARRRPGASSSKCSTAIASRRSCPRTSPTSRCRSASPRCCARGSDVTLVTYGATLRIVMEAAELLARGRHRRRGDRRADAAAVRPAAA